MAKKRVISKTKVIRFIVILLLLLVLLSMLFSFVWYKVNIKKVNNNDKVVPFLVNENDTYITIVDDLKEKDLIRSALAYKIYLKLNKTDKLVVGVYPLKQNMSVKDIIETFKKGPDDSLTNTKITFNEGINVRKIASKIEENTKYKKEDVYNLLKDTKFLDTLINKYWFITRGLLIPRYLYL